MKDSKAQKPGGIEGIGKFTGKPVDTRKVKTNTQTGVGSRAKSIRS